MTRIALTRARRMLYGLVGGVANGGDPVVLTVRGVSVAAIVPPGVVNVLAALRAQTLPMPEGFVDAYGGPGPDAGPQGALPAGGAATPAGAPRRARAATGGAHEASATEAK